MSMYTTAQASRLLNWPDRRLRLLARAGVFQPVKISNQYRFGFADLALGRQIDQLLGQGARLNEIRDGLQLLQSGLPDSRPLTAIPLRVHGRKLAYKQGDSWIESASGQHLIDGLDAAAEHAPVAEMKATPPQADDQEAREPDALEVALEADEKGDVASACLAYRKHLAQHPDDLDAWVNLGRVEQQRGALDAAQRCYENVVARATSHPIAHFNLGTLFEDRGMPQLAVEAYLVAAEALPDADYNLARIYESGNNEQAALKHFSRYLRARR